MALHTTMHLHNVPAGREAEYSFNPDTFDRLIRDYNVNDLAI